MLRKSENQQLFENYYYDKNKGEIFGRKISSNPTNYTE
jgi:hypothetical protein